MVGVVCIASALDAYRSTVRHTTSVVDGVERGSASELSGSPGATEQVAGSRCLAVARGVWHLAAAAVEAKLLDGLHLLPTLKTKNKLYLKEFRFKFIYSIRIKNKLYLKERFKFIYSIRIKNKLLERI